jgi:SulP family sulfate permease
VAVLVFIIKYSRINVVKYALSGVNFRSRVERPVPYRWLLNKKGEQLHILKLQGFIFFGTANNLLNQVLQRINTPDLLPLRYVVLDFSQVTGLDSSALNSFERLTQQAEALKFHLIFTHLSPRLRLQFERRGLTGEDARAVEIFPDLDHGVEWCENQIIVHEKAALELKDGTRQSKQRHVILESTFDDMMKVLDQQQEFETLVERMMPYLESREVQEGSHLIRQGDPLAGLYFIESGQVTVQLEQADGQVVRLRTMGVGSVVGEWTFYAGVSASSSVIVNKPGMIYFLSVDRLRQMDEMNPEIAADLHRYMARLLSERLAATNRTMRSLMGN